MRIYDLTRNWSRLIKRRLLQVFPCTRSPKKGVEKTNTAQSRELGNEKTSEEQSKAKKKEPKLTEQEDRGGSPRIGQVLLWFWLCGSDSGWGSTPPVLNSNVKSRCTWFSARPRWPSGLSACPSVRISFQVIFSPRPLSPSVSLYFACLSCVPCLLSVLCFQFSGDCCRWRHFGLGLRLLLATEVASGAIGHLYRWCFIMIASSSYRVSNNILRDQAQNSWMHNGMEQALSKSDISTVIKGIRLHT